MPADPRLFPATLPVLTTLRRSAGGRAWLAELPALVEELSERWQLRPDAPYHGGSCAWVAPATRADGGRAVLKVTWPHREARAEGRVMRAWRGRGAAEVYAHDPRHHALLLERCELGTPLWRSELHTADERLAAGCTVLRRLWDAGDAAAEELHPRSASERPAEKGRAPEAERRAAERQTPAGSGTAAEPPAPGDEWTSPDTPELLAEVAADWADLVDERTARHTWPREVDTGLFAAGAELLRQLPYGASRNVVLHGDFNPGNVLSAQREPWLAIDAKPMVGDAAYDPWPLIQQIDGAPAAGAGPGPVGPSGAAGSAEAAAAARAPAGGCADGASRQPAPDEGELRALLRHRTALAADALDLDVHRLRAWALARHVEYTLWAVDRATRGDGADGTEHAEHGTEHAENAEDHPVGPSAGRTERTNTGRTDTGRTDTRRTDTRYTNQSDDTGHTNHSDTAARGPGRKSQPAADTSKFTAADLQWVVPLVHRARTLAELAGV